MRSTSRTVSQESVKITQNLDRALEAVPARPDHGSVRPDGQRPGRSQVTKDHIVALNEAFEALATGLH
jgi:hypothetical protein